MLIFSTAVKFFFLLTPFFVLSLFLDVCGSRSDAEKRRIATRTALWIFFICVLLLLFGNRIFSCLGITLLAFQIGSGIILLLSGIDMVRSDRVSGRDVISSGDPSLIPLTLPITVGPGTVGALFVLGAGDEMKTFSLAVQYVAGLALSVFCIWILLYFSGIFFRLLKTGGLMILSRLTGLFLAILAVQSIINGVTALIRGW